MSTQQVLAKRLHADGYALVSYKDCGVCLDVSLKAVWRTEFDIEGTRRTVEVPVSGDGNERLTALDMLRKRSVIEAAHFPSWGLEMDPDQWIFPGDPRFAQYALGATE